MMVKKKIKEEEGNDPVKNDGIINNEGSGNLPEMTEESNSGELPEEKGEVASEEDISSVPSSADKVVEKEKGPEEKLAELQDKYLRLSAEFDNYRKRTLREKIELSKLAGKDLLLKILPVMDDFERALSNMETSSDCVALKNGIDLIYIKFSDFLNQNGVREIDALNSRFNVDLHDAVAKVPVQDEKDKGIVVEVLQKGYYLHDKVIRHSKVVVGE